MRNGNRKLKGYNCECCGQYVKEYKRTLYSAPTEALIKLYNLDNEYPDCVHHISDFGAAKIHGGGDFAKTAYWGLTELEPTDEDEDKRTSGFWSITRKGRQFVQNRLVIPKYCHVYNGTIIRFSGPKVSVVDALGKDFSYEELMN